MFYFWLSIVLFLGLIELATINLVSIWFVISALISLAISFVSDNFILQFAVFVLLGIFLMILTKKPLEKWLSKINLKTNLDRVVGMKGIVTEDIDEMHIGEVKVDGKRWSAFSKESLKKGDLVKILQIKGVKLEVKSWEE